jgi:O-glycosyl hydrolase
MVCTGVSCHQALARIQAVTQPGGDTNLDATKTYEYTDHVMTHKYKECIVILLINKSVESNEKQKVLTNSFDQEFTVNTSKHVSMGI